LLEYVVPILRCRVNFIQYRKFHRLTVHFTKIYSRAHAVTEQLSLKSLVRCSKSDIGCELLARRYMGPRLGTSSPQRTRPATVCASQRRRAPFTSSLLVGGKLLVDAPVPIKDGEFPGVIQNIEAKLTSLVLDK
jgi:hypothetical protein